MVARSGLRNVTGWLLLLVGAVACSSATPEPAAHADVEALESTLAAPPPECPPPSSWHYGCQTFGYCWVTLDECTANAGVLGSAVVCGCDKWCGADPEPPPSPPPAPGSGGTG